MLGAVDCGVPQRQLQRIGLCGARLLWGRRLLQRNDTDAVLVQTQYCGGSALLHAAKELNNFRAGMSAARHSLHIGSDFHTSYTANWLGNSPRGIVMAKLLVKRPPGWRSNCN